MGLGPGHAVFRERYTGLLPLFGIGVSDRHYSRLFDQTDIWVAAAEPEGLADW